MKIAGFIGYVSIALVVGCGGSEGGVSADPGDGSGTLEVRASIDNEDTGAEMTVHVKRGGLDVQDASITIGSDNGDVTVGHLGADRYETEQAGWADSYTIDVTSGDDWLDGGLESPARLVLTSPEITQAIDPSAAEGGVILFQWDPPLAHTVKVKLEDFEWEGPDTGSLEVPASVFDKVDPELEITRENTTLLEGGTAGSRMTIEHKMKVKLVVVNPVNE